MAKDTCVPNLPRAELQHIGFMWLGHYYTALCNRFNLRLAAMSWFSRKRRQLSAN
jgi:hypothetical protein